MQPSGIKQQLAPAPPAKGTISLLVAEDDKIVRTLLNAVILKQFPEVTIHLAEDGRVGVELFRKHAPQIVITDVNMPVLDGIQMAREIRSLRAATKIIVVTAYDNSDYYEKFDKIGVEDFIVKPITFDKLFAAIEKCLAAVAPAR
jgi:YesN/AraC family two-component response regulator